MNTIGASTGGWEFHIVAFIGIILQSGVLAWDAVITYHFQWDKGSLPVAVYAYPLTLIGNIGIVVGMYLCAYIIESSTEEHNWYPLGDVYPSEDAQEPQRIIWIQKKQVVGDQGFEPFAIYAPASHTRLVTSHSLRDKSRFYSHTLVATVVSVAGMMPFLLLKGT